MQIYNPDDQRLFINDVINCRELGGMPCEDGILFESNRFLRSGAPTYATEEGIKLLKDYGVKTVIDVRALSEVNRLGNPFKEDKDINYYNIPLLVGDPDDLSKDPTMIFLRDHHLGDFYVIALEQLKDQIAKVLRILISNSDGICLFHCAHGKDRTGIIAAILYLIAGASHENIIKNYEMSYIYAKDFLDEIMDKREDCLKHTLRSDAINMEIMLDYLDKEYNGSIIDYLTSIGLTNEELKSLKDRCLT